MGLFYRKPCENLLRKKSKALERIDRSESGSGVSINKMYAPKKGGDTTLESLFASDDTKSKKKHGQFHVNWPIVGIISVVAFLVIMVIIALL